MDSSRVRIHDFDVTQERRHEEFLQENVIYNAFTHFKYLNQKYSYQADDQLLKDFTRHIIEALRNESAIYFTRVVADQFILLMSIKQPDDTALFVHTVNERFVHAHSSYFPGVGLRIRFGIYFVPPGCTSASAAIDAANYARRQVSDDSSRCVCIYDEDFAASQVLEIDIINGMSEAFRNEEFLVYLQSKFLLKDFPYNSDTAVGGALKSTLGGNYEKQILCKTDCCRGSMFYRLIGVYPDIT